MIIISIIKEALNNTSKHSNADLIKINLRQLGTHCQLTISDNGQQNHKTSHGIGLINMKDRIESLGGIININHNNGFKIHITIPKEELK